MKKTRLALAVPALLVAGSANAAINIYNANGVVVDLGAAAEVQYIKVFDDDRDPTLRIDDGDLFVNTSVEIMPGIRAIATVGFEYESDGQASADVTSDELFVGFSSDFGTTTFGRQYTIADSAGNTKDYELATAGVTFGDTQSNRVIKYMFDNGGPFYAGFSTILDNDSLSNVSQGSAYDGVIGLRGYGLDTRVFIYSGMDMSSRFASQVALNAVTGGQHLQDIHGFNFEVDYTINVFDFSASYGIMDFEANVNRLADGTFQKPVLGENEVTAWQVAAGYQADERTYFALGYANLESDPQGNYEKVEAYNLYTNVTYALHNNAKIYAEIGIANQKINNIETNQNDVGYVLGMEVSF